MVFDQIPNNYNLLVELLYIMRTGNKLRMCEKTLTVWSRFDFFQAYICWLLLFLPMPISTVSDAVPNYC